MTPEERTDGLIATWDREGLISPGAADCERLRPLVAAAIRAAEEAMRDACARQLEALAKDDNADVHRYYYPHDVLRVAAKMLREQAYERETNQG